MLGVSVWRTTGHVETSLTVGAVIDSRSSPFAQAVSSRTSGRSRSRPRQVLDGGRRGRLGRHRRGRAHRAQCARCGRYLGRVGRTRVRRDRLRCGGVSRSLLSPDRAGPDRSPGQVPGYADDHRHPRRQRAVDAPAERGGGGVGFTGRWYHEGTGLLSSWRNPRSFWPTPESFHRMLDQAGYNLVLAVEPWYLPDRTFFLALPGSS